MTNYLLEEYYFKLKLIGIYQIIGGLIGLGLTIWLMTILLPMPFPIACIVIISIGLFLFSIACGLGLYFKKWIAINLSLVFQLLQIISFTLYGYSFKLISGLGALLNLDFANSLKVQIILSEPLFRFTYLIDPNEKVIGVNLVAILIGFFIIDLKKKIAYSLSKC